MNLDVSHAYLMAEFRRIDLLIRRQVRRFQAAGHDPAETFRGLFVTDAKADQLAARRFAGNWAEGIELPAGADDEFIEAMAQAEADTVALQERSRIEGHSLHLVRMANAFDLDRFDVDTLLIALAPSYEFGIHPHRRAVGMNAELPRMETRFGRRAQNQYHGQGGEKQVHH